MKKKNKGAKINMFEHSKAKVELYSNYFATYLNILSRVDFIKRIHVFDIMCGEGKYLDGSKGSPLLTLEKIKDHYYSNKKTCPHINVWFNDNGSSDIEPGKFKVDRVKELSHKIFIPETVNVRYSKQDYSEIYPGILSILRALKDERALIFIDPYGYKEVTPSNLKELLAIGKTEVILFLPISHMYRFATKSLEDSDFQGGMPLKNFLEPID